MFAKQPSCPQPLSLCFARHHLHRKIPQPVHATNAAADTAVTSYSCYSGQSALVPVTKRRASLRQELLGECQLLDLVEPMKHCSDDFCFFQSINREWGRVACLTVSMHFVRSRKPTGSNDDYLRTQVSTTSQERFT